MLSVKPTITLARPPVAIVVISLPQLLAQPARRCRRPGRRTRRRSRTGGPPRWTCRSACAAALMSTFVSRAARDVSASIEISMPGLMMPPRYSPGRGDDVVVDRGAEVDDHAGAPAAGRSRRPRSRAGRRPARAGCRAGSACRSWCPARRSAPRGRDSARTCCRYSDTSCGTTDETASPSIWSKLDAAQREQVVDHHRQLVAGRLRGRSRSASARRALAPSKAPTCVWVLPTSIVRSTAAIIPQVQPARRSALDALTVAERREAPASGAPPGSSGRGELEQRHEHEAARA